MRQKLTLLTVLALASFTLVLAQTGRIATVTVPFDFIIGDKTFPAGQYTVNRTNPEMDILLISGAKTEVQVPVVTRLAQVAKMPETGAFVFDKIGERRYLSEVWAPGVDGFLVRSASEKHTHDIVKAKK